MERKGCPNLEVKIEGKGILSSGRYVTRCRAQNRKELSPDTVIRLCVDNQGLGYAECCNLCNSTAATNNPSWKQCRYSKHIYG